MKAYGKELILDLKNCDRSTFNRATIEVYLIHVCMMMDMERCELHFWDYKDDPEGYAAAPAHLKGTTAVQFILTSNITIHTLDELGLVFINIFSCKDFDDVEVAKYTRGFFEGTITGTSLLRRG